MKRRLERIDESVARFRRNWRPPTARGCGAGGQGCAAQDKIAKLKEEVARLNAINAEMMKSEDKQISLTDPDARSMATSGKDAEIVGYNVQTAVDTKNHLIVAHEVTNVGTDRRQLSNIAEQARTEMGVETLDAVADRGYYAGEEIRACEEAGIAVALPKPMTSNSKAAVASASRTSATSRRTMLMFVLRERRLASPTPPRTTASSYVATGPMRVRLALSSIAARPAPSDSSRDRSVRPCSRRCGTSRSPSGKKTIRAEPARHDQMLDGMDALSYEEAAEGCDRDGAQRARLQHQARDDDPRRGRAIEGAGGVSQGVLRVQINASRRPGGASGWSESRILLRSVLHDREIEVANSNAAVSVM